MMYEVFYMDEDMARRAKNEGEFFIDNLDHLTINDLVGWYWWTCMPGCTPDSEPQGPFNSEEEAHEDAKEDV